MLKKTLENLVRASGLDPDKIIMWEAVAEPQPLAEPHRIIVTLEDLEDRQIRALSSALRESMKQEIINELSPESDNFAPREVGPEVSYPIWV